MSIKEILDSHVDISDGPFESNEEDIIVSLMFDYPDFFASISKFIKPEFFNKAESQYIIAHINRYLEKYGVYPTRGILTDIIKRELTADSIGADDILNLINRESDPREVPAIKDRLINWARERAYGIIYSDDAYDEYKRGNFDYLEELINKARTIQDISAGAIWFFDDIDKLFVEDLSDKFTTGFQQLDKNLNNGGPCRKEMVVWMAPTGVGKSIMLINNAVRNVLDGRNVLYITLELQDILTAARAMGVFTNNPIKNRFDYKDKIVSMIKNIKSKGTGDLVIKELPPDEISVDEIHAYIDTLRRTKSWEPDIVVIDYLELMVSRRASDNKDDYSKQKSVSTQVRGLAIKEDVLVFTATQTNRSGNDTDEIDVTKISESYGKSMPIDYLISINQTKDEYHSGDNGGIPSQAFARLFIAKNRNGPKHKSIPVNINYNNMTIKEIQ